MKIFLWVLGLTAMALYQNWVYSTFWIDEQNVENVGQAVRFSDDISFIECTERKRRFGSVSVSFFIKLKNGQILDDVSARGTVRDCDTFYSQFDDIFIEKRLYTDEIPLMITRVGEYLYSPIFFEGYFFGKRELKVSFDNYVWLPYKKMKSSHRTFVFWMSLTPIAMVVAVWLVRVFKRYNGEL